MLPLQHILHILIHVHHNPQSVLTMTTSTHNITGHSAVGNICYCTCRGLHLSLFNIFLSQFMFIVRTQATLLISAGHFVSALAMTTYG